MQGRRQLGQQSFAEFTYEGWCERRPNLRALPHRDPPCRGSSRSDCSPAGMGCRPACIRASCIASFTSALSPSSERRYRLSRQTGSSCSSAAQREGAECPHSSRAASRERCTRTLTAVLYASTLLALDVSSWIPCTDVPAESVRAPQGLPSARHAVQVACELPQDRIPKSSSMAPPTAHLLAAAAQRAKGMAGRQRTRGLSSPATRS